MLSMCPKHNFIPITHYGGTNIEGTCTWAFILNFLFTCRQFDMVQISNDCTCTGFIQVMENLESHGILQFHFPGLESPEIYVWVMESHGKSVCFLRIKGIKIQS